MNLTEATNNTPPVGEPGQPEGQARIRPGAGTVQRMEMTMEKDQTTTAADNTAAAKTAGATHQSSLNSDTFYRYDRVRNETDQAIFTNGKPELDWHWHNDGKPMPWATVL
jgi:hypothetical protein